MVSSCDLLRARIPLVSSNGREKFILDLRKSRVDLSKGTYQNRGREVVVLVRLDYGGAPHRNPDGGKIESPHLHRYQEGYADKWAKPLPEDFFANREDDWWFKDFMRYCNIVSPSIIQQSPLHMIKEVRMLLESYYRWLRKQTTLREIKDWIEIATPYLDRHNDCLQIYVRRAQRRVRADG